jgi:hypothetical protein
MLTNACQNGVDGEEGAPLHLIEVHSAVPLGAGGIVEERAKDEPSDQAGDLHERAGTHGHGLEHHV